MEATSDFLIALCMVTKLKSSMNSLLAVPEQNRTGICTYAEEPR